MVPSYTIFLLLVVLEAFCIAGLTVVGWEGF